jgi:beta-galactosidase
MKYSIYLILITVFLSLCSNSSNRHDEKINKDFFPFSVWYSGGKARAPMLSRITPNSELEWRKDLTSIKDLGFNTVRTWVEWSTCEPEKGKYNFENLKLLLRLADEVGLKVFIQMYVDSAPDWVGKTYSEYLYETQSGVKVYPQSAPGACVDNHEVSKTVYNFFTETAKVASAYPSFFGWDLWSEPHIINWAHLDYVPNVQYCFCEGTQNSFREWLLKKYGNLEEINKAWHRNFQELTDIEPPRFSTILSYVDFLDWKSFIYEKLAEDMENRYKAIRQGDNSHLITAHAVGASIYQSPHVGNGASDDFLMAKPLDYYGVSLYPKHNHPDRHWSTTTFRTTVDFTRSANRQNKGWYVGELQAGFGTISLLISDPVTYADQKMWALSAIAKGAKGINVYSFYPMSSGYEAGGYGLIELDGTLTDRATKLGRLAKMIDTNQDIFLKAQPIKSEVGILYNPLNQMVGGMQRRDYGGAFSRSLIGYYQIFANNNIPADFIHRTDIENNDLDQYKVLILPYSLMFTHEMAENIKQFVKNGGKVVAEARTAWIDNRGYSSSIYPGMGLHEVFGVREKHIRMSENKFDMVVTHNENTLCENIEQGETLKGSLHLETFSILNGSKTEILAESSEGDPVIVSNQYGKGKTLILGSYLGQATYSEDNGLNESFILNILDWANIERPYKTNLDGRKSNQVEIALQSFDDSFLLYIISHSENDESFEIELKTEANTNYKIEDLFEYNKSFQLKSQESFLKMNLNVYKKDVRILKIEKLN